MTTVERPEWVGKRGANPHCLYCGSMTTDDGVAIDLGEQQDRMVGEINHLRIERAELEDLVGRFAIQENPYRAGTDRHAFFEELLGKARQWVAEKYSG